MSIIDNFLKFAYPKAAYERAQYRLATQQLEQVRKYDAASRSRRTSDWTTINTSSTQELMSGLNIIRARSRELVRNDPNAYRAVQSIANNVVGVGIRPAIVANSKRNKMITKREWDAWAGKTVCDFDGMLSFYGIQKLVMRTVAEAGEAIIIRRRSRGRVPIELQVLDPEYLDTSKNTFPVVGRPFVVMGIEFNEIGKKVAYHLYDANPSDKGFTKSSRVPIEDVIHVFEALRPGQVRGIPHGVSGFLRLKDLSDYEDAQLTRQKIASCYSVFISSHHDLAGPSGTMGTTTDGDITERLQPGIIQRTQPGDQITFADPPGVEGHAEYIKTNKQAVAAGYGITYEMMTGDLSNVNFSSGRMGWIEMHRNIEALQELMIVPQLCERVFEWFIDAITVRGTLSASADVSATWTPPRREMIDPTKETKAIIEQIKAGLLSWPEAVRMYGYDPEMTMQEMIEHLNEIDKNGLKLSTDYRNDMKNISTDPSSSS